MNKNHHRIAADVDHFLVRASGLASDGDQRAALTGHGDLTVMACRFTITAIAAAT